MFSDENFFFKFIIPFKNKSSLTMNIAGIAGILNIQQKMLYICQGQGSLSSLYFLSKKNHFDFLSFTVLKKILAQEIFGIIQLRRNIVYL